MLTVLHNQSLLDIAVQEDGSVLSVVEWSLKNEIPITAEITPGQQLNAPEESAIRFAEVANFFKNNRIVIATYLTEKEKTNSEFPQGEFAISF